VTDLHVVAVAPYVPYDGILHAGGEYLLRHLHALSRSARVTLLVPGSDDAVADAAKAPPWLELVVAPIDLAGRSTTRWLLDAAYRRLMAAPPMPTAESLRAVRAGGLVERARAADVVELHWPEYARFAAELRAAGVTTPVSVVEHDVDVRGAWRRLRTRVSGYRMLLGVATSPLSRARELAGLRAADLVCVFKSADEQLLRGLGIDTTVRVLAPWIEEAPHASSPRRPHSVLFTGAMWRPENDLGARWFVREVWPRVRAQVPDARLVVAGARPTAALQEAADGVGGVELTGTVESLLPYYQQASVFVAPLFSGGGLKFKVAQAMLCGLPVVGTPLALEGVAEEAPEGTLWAVTQEPAQMAEQLIAALREPVRAAAVGAAAARWAAGRWSFARSIAAVVDDYRALAARSRG
jgi:glycosyltransferase involved in cell wall biosynthesis